MKRPASALRSNDLDRSAPDGSAYLTRQRFPLPLRSPRFQRSSTCAITGPLSTAGGVGQLAQVGQLAVTALDVPAEALNGPPLARPGQVNPGAASRRTAARHTSSPAQAGLAGSTARITPGQKAEHPATGPALAALAPVSGRSKSGDCPGSLG